MDYSVLTKSALFRGLTIKEMQECLESVPHHIRCYDKDEVIFHLMDQALRIGIILEGRIQAQKTFPSGSQVNVSVRGPGEMIGPAAVFSVSHRYPCDLVSLEPASVLMFHREDLLAMMQKDVRILENFTTEMASATYMLQQRLELFSYSGITQKAAFWLLMQARQTGKQKVMIPESVSKWAMLMNVSRPSLHREIKHLDNRRIIRYSPPSIEILDTEALEEILGK